MDVIKLDISASIKTVPYIKIWLSTMWEEAVPYKGDVIIYWRIIYMVDH